MNHVECVAELLRPHEHFVTRAVVSCVGCTALHLAAGDAMFVCGIDRAYAYASSNESVT